MAASRVAGLALATRSTACWRKSKSPNSCCGFKPAQLLRHRARQRRQLLRQNARVVGGDRGAQRRVQLGELGSEAARIEHVELLAHHVDHLQELLRLGAGVVVVDERPQARDESAQIGRQALRSAAA